MAKDLVTKNEYKNYAGISSQNQDDIIDTLIPKISALVKTYCKQSFIDYYGDPKSETFNGGTQSLILKEYPVRNIYSVEYSLDYGQTYDIMVDYQDFIPNYQDGSVDSTDSINGFIYRQNGYIVTYSAGYEATPEDVKLAVFDLITYYMQNDGAIHSNKAPGTNTVQIEYISTTRLPAHIKRVLDQYVLDYA